ncbi:luciferin 4-monooxygenase [Anabrus simplex]|uniref:luciferin 4-monooxygenase n=1 Tax=Anabrus simplex TaxID=316456 RepID=UPI0035A31CB8
MACAAIIWWQKSRGPEAHTFRHLSVVNRMSEQQLVLSGPQLRKRLPEISPGEYLLQRLRLHGDRTAQIYLEYGRSFTFSQLAQQACSVAQELRARDVREGDIVAVCSHVRPEFTPIMLGTMFTGAALAPLTTAYDRNDFTSILSLLKPVIIFTVPDTQELIRSVLSTLHLHTEVVVLGENSSSWQKFLRHEVQQDFKVNELTDLEDKTALIMASSGTTGVPKCIIISQRSLLVELMIFNDRRDVISEGDKMLLFSSPSWISATILYYVALDLGIELLAGSKFEEEAFFKIVRDHKVTFTFLSTNLVMSLAKCSVADEYDISSLRCIFCAGSAMRKDAQLMAESVLGKKVCQAYGLTEILFLTIAVPGDGCKAGGSGRLVALQTCKVVDVETGHAMGANAEGELCFKGPTLTKGYYHNPAATAGTIDEDGWLHSGDIGYYDDNGFIYVVDRIKDLIKYRGFHITPVEIETQLLEHPGVKEVAVVGVDDDLDQEHPLAVVVRQPGSDVTEEELMQFAASRMAEYKWLRGGVRFEDHLPKTSTGKIARRAVKRMIMSRVGSVRNN